MSSKLCLLILLIALIPATTLFAGTTGKIAGVVTDATSGDPLPGVNVVVDGTALGTATDLSGEYFILKVPPGVYSVTAKMMGYKNLKKTQVRVIIDQTTNVDFTLETEVIEGETVIVISERPVIEKELTASKLVISDAELQNSWVSDVEEAISVQSGVNVHGGVRGGFGTDVSYYIDCMSMREEGAYCMSMREEGAYSNITSVNKTSIQEMQVLTGGYNAEYGQANGAIVNIVSKSSAEKIHGTIQYRYRPAGKYHWGRNIYSKDNWEWRVLGQVDAWNPSKKGWNPVDPDQAGSNGGMPDATPEERLASWIDFISAEPLLTDYAERPD